MGLKSDHRKRKLDRTPESRGAGPRGSGPLRFVGHKHQASRPTSKPPADAPKAKMPRHVKPMLASLVAQPFDRPGWFFEVKWDGYRAIAEVDRHGVAFYSRNHKSFEHRFAPVVQALRDLGHEAVLDGEVVVVDEAGRSHFQLLQNYQKTGEGRLLYYVFDLLYLDGRDLRGLPLKRRKELLQGMLGESSVIRLSEHVETAGVVFLEAAGAHGLEGIVGKDAASPYREGVRGGEWVKVKTHRRQEAVIAGFTEPRGSRKALGALVLGVYEHGDLVYIGHTGGGLTDDGLAELHSRLTPLVQDSCPFKKRPKTNAPVHWVSPRLVCEVSFQQWTDDGRMRHPIFVGLREDKAARSVHRERAAPVPGLAPTPAPNSSSSRTRRATPGEHPEPPLSNLDKVYWPAEGYTKGDLLAYYREVAAVILPYLHDRPQSLHRHPNGIGGKSFFQKDAGRQSPPAWVETVPVASESNGKDIRYLVCQDAATLLYVANLGCIELNPWNSRVGSLGQPDYLVIDLDPDDIAFSRVVEAALAVRKTLDRAGAPGFCKTSGKRGLHVCVPLGACYDYDLAKQLAELIANLVHGELPASTSVVRRPALRRQRVYVDFLQNRRGQTLAAPYSVRPYPGATVSTPLRWEEVRPGLDPSRFTMLTLPKRLEKVGDLWSGVLGPGVDLQDCLERLRLVRAR